MRGCEFVLAQRYIEPPYILKVYFPNVEGINGLESMIAGVATESLGPGLEIKRAPTGEDPLSVMYRLRIWGTLTVFATVLPPE